MHSQPIPVSLLAAVLCLPAALLCLPAPLAAQNVPDAQLWLTTLDRSSLFALQPAPLHFSAAVETVPAVTVNDMQQFQPIEGFGFAVTGGSAQLLMRMSPEKRSALLKQVFSPQGGGIGASYIRVTIGSSDMNDHVYSYDDMAAGQTDPDLKHFSLAPDHADVIPVLKEILAIDPQIRILASPWSAPAWMKTNDDVRGGELKPECYGAYANYLVKYIQAMQAEGIPLTAITVENEPLNPKNTPSMVVFAQQEDTFIGKYLGPAFQAAGIKTEIQLYDHNPDVPSYPLSILADPVAGKYAIGTAFHLYGGDSSTLTDVHNQYPNKNLYLTEQSVTERPHSSSINIAEPVSRVLIGATRNWSRNVLLWNLAADPQAGPHTNNGGCGGCFGAITLDGDNATLNLAYYALAHFSKFVRPGSVRIGSSELEQLSTAAFLTPTGKVVLVVSNTGNFAIPFAIHYHGESVQTNMPSESVGTYVW
ncbi:MAG TPA: glycoside hydrolase family 30 beta sandwich domain-containing protein [Terracidiphilus sp.]|jgi:glucosylceramidase|nr:glycoside hydrolase family 30 beta sandwich domain-containing protein [Terracidiphilus sp.]